MHGTAIALLCVLALLGCGSSGDNDPSSKGGTGGKGAAGMGAAGMMSGSAGSAAPAATWTQIFEMMFPCATDAHCDRVSLPAALRRRNGNLSMGTDKDSAYMALVNKNRRAASAAA